MLNGRDQAAYIFRALATLIDSGVPTASAWDKVGVDSLKDKKRVSRILHGGHPLSFAVMRGNFLSKLDGLRLAAAESAGQTSFFLKQLADEREQQRLVLNKLISRYYFSLIMVSFAFSIGLVIVNLKPHLDLFSYFMGSILKLMLFVLFMFQLAKLTQKEVGWWMEKIWVLRLRQRRIPGLVYGYHWMGLLSLQLRSGIDPKTCLIQMSDLINDASYRDAMNDAKLTIDKGGSLLLALVDSSLVIDDASIKQIRAGEASGDLEGALTLQLNLMCRELNTRMEGVVSWLSRIIFIITIVLMSTFILV